MKTTYNAHKTLKTGRDIKTFKTIYDYNKNYMLYKSYLIVIGILIKRLELTKQKLYKVTKVLEPTKKIMWFGCQ